jgi:flagellar biosynthesis/type III secretory pathway ATPase
MPAVTEEEHRRKAAKLREWIGVIRDSEDLVSVGAYVPGSNPAIDEARSKRDAITAFLCQRSDTVCAFTDSLGAMQAL